MKPSLSALALLLGACCLPAQAQDDGTRERAARTCEDAVGETVQQMRGRAAQEVQFVGSKRAVAPTSEAKIGVRGEGVYRGPGSGDVRFTYSCAFDTATGGTSGVLFRDDARPQASAQPVEPDLALISPEACETATAEALKQKYPRVGRIVFDVSTRAVEATPDRHHLLRGQVAVERAPGMASIPMTYRCRFAPRTGALVDTTLDG
ncbi:hypothetical protein IS481_09150 [Caldimonas thermodepolymerans]|uniref:Uncharacterized protein n=1 Tax=Caldimonas thermodepolymerans TaxID=215580 RepID=A0A2S5T6L7_9BURK|nr:hypothetical protein [Caldimonas thermodepolymerans]PPE70630.1 hypothetical protein C1702_05655 [Caldimonas thermodepolymerans]QPC29989.1 hypothetical protein IS481_09150 [Caldimonas thermodepolymerans]RDH97609.1 hypothetical protein DES46_108122 [Caldimonas thermodepolymerans]TCP10022.1 hypothetical protein EV676_101606 [Caldimonas thermodepolymerans]UZG46404.1 hypothetical protein ONS87_10500 [Caldimonas thermodepolymerans]